MVVIVVLGPITPAEIRDVHRVNGALRLRFFADRLLSVLPESQLVHCVTIVLIQSHCLCIFVLIERLGAAAGQQQGRRIVLAATRLSSPQELLLDFLDDD